MLAAVADEIAAALRVLARHRIGALVLWDPVGVVEGGVLIDAPVSRELLITVALPEYLNKLVGAVVVRGDRVERVAVPITWVDVVGRAFELAAGVAIAVDEDTGKIQVVDRMGHVEVDELADVLQRYALEAGRR